MGSVLLFLFFLVNATAEPKSEFVSELETDERLVRFIGMCNVALSHKDFKARVLEKDRQMLNAAWDRLKKHLSKKYSETDLKKMYINALAYNVSVLDEKKLVDHIEKTLSACREFHETILREM
ncbi:MAG TPA: hypothetical protein VJB18_02440 [Burkholderiales bacterium]|nr:hypothetical protein [Burkholderiales bacterium]